MTGSIPRSLADASSKIMKQAHFMREPAEVETMLRDFLEQVSWGNYWGLQGLRSTCHKTVFQFFYPFCLRCSTHHKQHGLWQWHHYLQGVRSQYIPCSSGAKGVPDLERPQMSCFLQTFCLLFVEVTFALMKAAEVSQPKRINRDGMIKQIHILIYIYILLYNIYIYIYMNMYI